MDISVDIDLQGWEWTALEVTLALLRRNMAAAINLTMKDVIGRLKNATVEVFDSPTAFTQNAFGQHYAHGTDDEPVGEVFVYDRQAQYLAPEILGGPRVAGDYATTSLGPIVPLQGAELNSYGNMPRNYIHDSIRQGAFWFKTKRNRIALAAHLANGHLTFLAEIVPEADYDHPRLDWTDTIVQEVNHWLPIYFAEKMAESDPDQ